MKRCDWHYCQRRLNPVRHYWRLGVVGTFCTATCRDKAEKKQDQKLSQLTKETRS